MLNVKFFLLFYSKKNSVILSMEGLHRVELNSETRKKIWTFYRTVKEVDVLLFQVWELLSDHCLLALC